VSVSALAGRLDRSNPGLFLELPPHPFIEAVSTEDPDSRPGVPTRVSSGLIAFAHLLPFPGARSPACCGSLTSCSATSCFSHSLSSPVRQVKSCCWIWKRPLRGLHSLGRSSPQISDRFSALETGGKPPSRDARPRLSFRPFYGRINEGRARDGRWFGETLPCFAGAHLCDALGAGPCIDGSRLHNLCRLPASPVAFTAPCYHEPMSGQKKGRQLGFSRQDIRPCRDSRHDRQANFLGHGPGQTSTSMRFPSATSAPRVRNRARAGFCATNVSRRSRGAAIPARRHFRPTFRQQRVCAAARQHFVRGLGLPASQRADSAPTFSADRRIKSADRLKADRVSGCGQLAVDAFTLARNSLSL